MAKQEIDPFGILKPAEVTSATTKNTSQRRSVDVRDVAGRSKETFFGSRKRAIASGIAILTVWSLAGYNKDWVPSPTETVNGIVDAGQWIVGIPDRAWGDDNTASISPVVSTNSTSGEVTQSTIQTTLAPTSSNPTNLIPVLTPSTISVATTESLTETTAVAATQDHLPPIVQYSEAAGSVVCNDKEVGIHIDVNSKTPPLTQMAEQTGEPWDQGKPNSTIDEVLYQEASNGLTDFYVRLGCIGLEN